MENTVLKTAVIHITNTMKKGAKMNRGKILSYSKEELMFNKLFDIFNQNAIISEHNLYCVVCPNYNKEFGTCMITEILRSINIISETNLCYYNSITHLIRKYYPEFNDITHQTLDKFHRRNLNGTNLDSMQISFLNDELKHNLSSKFIDDMIFESAICKNTNYIEKQNLKINVILGFKIEIIYDIINKVYKEIKEKEGCKND